MSDYGLLTSFGGAPGDAPPLGDIVHYAMGDAGLILPAAVSAAMALQIHWALPRASSQLAQAPGAPARQNPKMHIRSCVLVRLITGPSPGPRPSWRRRLVRRSAKTLRCMS